MPSTFMGLETAKRGMFTQQSALYTTGHNISNANTPGYSRQRVNFQTTTPYPGVGLNRPEIPGQMGTGVETGSVERVRDGFLDVQYRTENNKLGYWSARSDALIKVEDVLNEPTDEGLAAVMSEMWQSLQDLSTTPENEGARGVVLERIQAVTDTFNYLSDSLNSVKKDFGNQLSVTAQAANSVIQQLFDVNREIAKIEPNGYLPNDLYDRRDALVDELSQYMNIKISTVPSGGNASKIAEGIYEVKLINADGTEGEPLLTKDTFKQLSFTQTGAVTTDLSTEYVSDIDLVEFNRDGETGQRITLDIADAGAVVFPQGELRGLIEAFGYKENGADPNEAVKGIYSTRLDSLDKLAYSLAKMFNGIHEQGTDLDTATSPVNEVFDLDDSMSETNYAGAASIIQLNSSFTMKDLAVSMNGDAGDGQNALNLANVGSMLLNASPVTLLGTKADGSTVSYSLPALPIKSGSLNTFYESVIGRLGVDSQQAQRMESNVSVLRESVETNRASVSSVSLDEEMTNLIKFQQAYNGAARMITIVDEMLDKVINGMGTGGR
ncbi:flagellar hook-associated protein FlgK [Domibacillus sp. PGB-M46]|uniref:flagellar hook-associated protein FlgK n=1 Tax=Domibacillus sp. PGB-M46 TaxID=2910255 RepID=UPI001F55CDBD|nr:flagellar hook-associated protein FlgK [Domibacillus sp. PGB-M46]MCI2253005.1 flagellar hook-associated protein FlgK [Domibacillus sp. PGB-M46]